MTDASGIFWTRPYLFFTERVPGITGAVRFQHPNQPGREYVLGLDLPLDNVLGALAELKVRSGGAAFLTEANGAVLLPPATGEGATSTFPVSLSPEQLDAGPVFAAMKAWLAAGRPARQALTYPEQRRRLVGLAATAGRSGQGVVAGHRGVRTGFSRRPAKAAGRWC